MKKLTDLEILSNSEIKALYHFVGVHISFKTAKDKLNIYEECVSLSTKGFLKTENEWFILTEKGEQFLELLRDANFKFGFFGGVKGEYFVLNEDWFNYWQISTKFDSISNLLQHLEKRGLIYKVSDGYFPTEKGKKILDER